MMKKERTFTLIVMGLVALLLSAGPVVLAGQDVPRIDSVSAAVSADNALIVEFVVETNVPATVYVDYEAPGVAKLRSKETDELAYSSKFSIVRLRADTEYSYKLFARDGKGSRTSPPYKGTFTTGSLPDFLAGLTINLVKGETTCPLIMLDRMSGVGNGFVALDSKANIVWYYKAGEGVQERVGDIAQDAEGNFVYAGAGPILMPNRKVFKINALGDQLAESSRLCELTEGYEGGVHHEVVPLNNGKILYLGREFFFVSTIGQWRVGDTIREWDPFFEEDVLLWKTSDLFDPERDLSVLGTTLMSCNLEDLPNWTHTNSLALGTMSNIIMSVRGLDSIISIEAELDGYGDIMPGDLQWVLAAEEYNELLSVPDEKKFTFKRDSDRFYRQHSVRQLPNGNILFFDNGVGRPEEEGGQYSRALELKLDFKKMEAKKVWEYKHPLPEGWVFSNIVSSAFRLDNGNTLICFGGPSSLPHRVVEADGGKDNTSVAVIELAAPGIQYRAHPLDSLYGETIVD